MQCRYNQKLLLWLSFIVTFIINQKEAFSSVNAQGITISCSQSEANNYNCSVQFNDINLLPNKKSITITTQSNQCNQKITTTLYKNSQNTFSGNISIGAACADWKLVYHFSLSDSIVYFLHTEFNEQHIRNEAAHRNLSSAETEEYFSLLTLRNSQANQHRENVTNNNYSPQAVCSNVDFEQGNLNNWNGYTGNNPGCCPTPGLVNGRHTILTGNGLDPCGGFPVVFPGGNFSVRLGNNGTGAQAEQLEQTFTVAANSSNFTYAYAVVMQDPGHTVADQPYFRIEVFDASGNPLPCAQYNVSAGQNIPGFINSTNCFGVVYKPWSSVNVDLSSYINQNVTIRFTTADCVLGGHYGYAYIDGSCLPLQITASDSLCTNGPVVLTAPIGSAAYSWIPGNQTAQSISVTTGGLYQCVLTSFQGCTITLSYNLTMYPLPNSAFTSQAFGCNNGFSFTDVSTISSGNIISWQWDFGDNTQSTLQNPTRNYLLSGNYNVQLITTSNNQCVDTVINPITVAQQLNVAASFNNVNCFGGNNGNATANPANGQQPYNYLWSTGATTPTVIGLSAGNYWVIITDANGCTAMTNVNISQPAALSLSTNQTDAICFGTNTGSAIVNPQGGVGPYTYLWNTNATTQAINNLVSGNYFVTVTDANNCTQTINVFINQPAQLLTTVVSQNNVSCFGGSNASITVQTVGGVGPYNYVWNTNPQQFTATATGLNSGTYQVIVTDANNCTTTIAVNIAQPQPLSATSVFVSPSCNGGNNGTATITVSGGNGPYWYNWNTTPPQFSQTAVALTAGNYQVTITDMNGCTLAANVAVTQPQPITTNFSALNNVSCFGGTNGAATINVAGGTAPFNYSWNTTPPQLTQSASGLSANNYLVYVTDANGCTTIAGIVIAQPAQMITNVSFGDTICPGNTVILSASATGGNGNYTFSWNQNLGIGASHVVSPNATTQYIVYTTDNMGCTSQPQTVTISVYALTATDVQVSPMQTICAGQQTQISSAVSGNTGPITYQWSHNLGNSPGPITVSPQTSTTYTLTVTNICGFTIVKTILVNVNPLPQVLLMSQSGSGCGSANYNFADTASQNTGASYFWNFGDGNTSALPQANHNYSQSGNYTITLVITSSQGCSNTFSTTYNAIVYPIPLASFTSTPTQVTNVYPLVSFLNTTINASSYSWDFGDGNNSLQQNPTHTYADKGIYVVTLYTSNNFGCRDTVSETLEINPEFAYYIPNAFTPNDDGDNDVFNGVGQEVTDFKMMIYNRWGELIYQTENVNKGWDGRAKGGDEVAQDGVYVYKIIIKDFELRYHEFTGSVTLLK